MKNTDNNLVELNHQELKCINGGSIVLGIILFISIAYLASIVD